MTSLMRWSPVGDLAAFEIARLQRMFDQTFGGEPLASGAWIPPVDIYETADHDVIVKVELPDMKRQDIKITFENSVLTVEGERKADPNVPRDHYHRVERGTGAFRRSFSMPAAVDGARIEAQYQDGVLTITLPRREETRPRQIQIAG
jgi:HSP20 family protein